LFHEGAVIEEKLQRAARKSTVEEALRFGAGNRWEEERKGGGQKRETMRAAY